MAEKEVSTRGVEGQKQFRSSNVKQSKKYERFGETIRYMTWQEWQRFLTSIDDYKHKLMMQTMYELGCRVGEFVRIQLLQLDFQRGRALFPKENTKTGKRRVSYLPKGLMNELTSWLKLKGRLTKRQERVKNPSEYLFSPWRNCQVAYSENRIRQIFRQYAGKAGLNRDYGKDAWGRKLHELTVHSLRHTHIMHYIHIHKLPIAVVQKQVGHTSLKTTSVYLNPSEEAVAEAYEQASRNMPVHHHNS